MGLFSHGPARNDSPRSPPALRRESVKEIAARAVAKYLRRGMRPVNVRKSPFWEPKVFAGCFSRFFLESNEEKRDFQP